MHFFPLNCGAVSDEDGERFHQNISVMEHRYKGKWSAAMLGDYCWVMLLKQNTIDRPKRNVVKVNNFPFIFIELKTMIVLLY